MLAPATRVARGLAASATEAFIFRVPELPVKVKYVEKQLAPVPGAVKQIALISKRAWRLVTASAANHFLAKSVSASQVEEED